MTKPTLLVLAAGMGSRYGGLKQMDAFGPNGETILDYSIFDAIAAGFGKVVFVIRESFKREFREFFAGKFDQTIEVEYVTQEISHVPKGLVYNPERTRPWGTAHAVLMASGHINEPFAVINADDFYGKTSYQVLADFFKNQEKTRSTEYALVAYDLVKTLSDHGTVNRGVCGEDANGYLTRIEETLKIGLREDKTIFYPGKEGRPEELDPLTPVSMNMWGFYPDYFQYCELKFKEFLSARGSELKSEFYIPFLIDDLISSGRKKVKMLRCSEDWFGVTYQEDKPVVIQKLNTLIRNGKYPENLWSR